MSDMPLRWTLDEIAIDSILRVSSETIGSRALSDQVRWRPLWLGQVHDGDPKSQRCQRGSQSEQIIFSRAYFQSIIHFFVSPDWEIRTLTHPISLAAFPTVENSASPPPRRSLASVSPEPHLSEGLNYIWQFVRG